MPNKPVINSQNGLLPPEHERALDEFTKRSHRAYKKHGNVRNQEWRDIQAEREAYLRKHNIIIYNPD